MSTPALNPLVEKIRTAHPGAYDDLDDAELTKRVLNKYPQYSDLAAPPVPDPRKQVDVQPSLLGDSPALETQAPRQNTQEDFPGFEGSYAANDPEKGAMTSGAGVAAAGTILGARALPTVGRLAAKHPILAGMAIGEARRIPYVGKYIPPLAEMLPALLGGKGAPEEAAAAEKLPPADIYRSGYRAPRAYYGGQPPEPIPPRNGLLLNGEVQPPLEGEYVASPPSTKTSVPSARATVVEPRAPESPPTPYRYGPGSIAREDVGSPNDTILGGNRGVIVPRSQIRALPPGPAPTRIDKSEWDAGHEIGSEIENTPQQQPEARAANGDYLKTPQGQRLTKIYQQTLKEHKAGLHNASAAPTAIEDEPEILRKPPTGTVTPQTSEEMQDALARSLEEVKKRKAQ